MAKAKVKAKLKTKAKSKLKVKVSSKSKSQKKLKSKGKVTSVKKVTKSIAKPVKKLAAKTEVKSAKKIDFKNLLTPLDDRIVVKLSGAEKKTPGGLIIPDTVADVSGNLQGIVISKGRGHQNKKGRIQPVAVEVGDQVVFSEFAGNKIKLHDQDLVIIREVDVLGTISK